MTRLYIQKIEIKNLFGKYCYQIPNPNQPEFDISKTFILYGDNGTGKTTILKLLYHLLSPSHEQGHRTYLLRVKFEYLSVLFSNQVSVIAYRDNTSIGDYYYKIIDNNEVVDHALIEGEKVDPDRDWITGISTSIDKDYAVRDLSSPEWEKVKNRLIDLDVNYYFLSDNRDFLSDRFSDYPSDIKTIRLSSSRFESMRERRKSDNQIDNLRTTIRLATRWIENQIKEAGSIADVNINHIYSEIIKSLSEPSIAKREKSISKEEIIDNLEALSENVNKFTKYGTIAEFKVLDLIEPLQNANKVTYYAIWSVLAPYIDSIEAKLKELDRIHYLLSTFTETLTEFYKDKMVTYQFTKGIQIFSDGEEIRPDMLSSGERQLMVLFCSIFLAHDKTSIFIIDEPEISLNVKWQRKLITTLFQLTRDSQVQFIFATHSIELLTKYDQHVIELIPVELC